MNMRPVAERILQTFENTLRLGVEDQAIFFLERADGHVERRRFAS